MNFYCKEGKGAFFITPKRSDSSTSSQHSANLNMRRTKRNGFRRNPGVSSHMQASYIGEISAYKRQEIFTNSPHTPLHPPFLPFRSNSRRLELWWVLTKGEDMGRTCLEITGTNGCISSLVAGCEYRCWEQGTVPAATKDGRTQLGLDNYHTIDFNFLVVSFSPL